MGGGLRVAKIEKWSDDLTLAESINYSYIDGGNKSTGLIGLAAFPYHYKIDNEASFASALNSGFSSITALFQSQYTSGQFIDTSVPGWSGCQSCASTSLPSANNYYAGAAIAFGGQIYSHIKGISAGGLSSVFNVYSSDCFIDLDNSSGKVGYSKVTVFKQGNGKEEYEFTNINDYPDKYMQFSLDGNGKQFTIDNQPVYLPITSPPFTPGTSKAYARGLLKHKKVYNENGDVVVELARNYVEKSLGEDIPALRCFLGKISTTDFRSITAQSQNNFRNTYYNIGLHYFPLKTMVLATEQQILPVASTKTFTYDENYPFLITKENTSTSDGNSYETNYFYIQNSAGNISYNTNEENDGLTLLQTGERRGVALGSTTKVNGTLINETKTGFKDVSGTAMPYNLYSRYNGNFNLKTSSIKYDSYGRMTSFLDERLQTNSIMYNSQGEIKIKAINAFNDENGLTSEFFFEDFESNGNSTLAHTGNKSYTGTYQTGFVVPNSRQ